jgi:hypothetical protein
MKAYIITTGTIFGLITLAHLWRAIAAEPAVANDPFFLALTALAAGLCIWAVGLLRRLPKE